MNAQFFKTLVLGISFLLLSMADLKAQGEPDSLRNLLPEVQGKERVDVLNGLASYTIYINQRETEDLLKESLELSESLDYGPGKVKALLVKATLYSQTSRLKQSEKLLNEAITFATEIDDQRGLALGQLTLGVLRGRQGKYSEAIEHHISGVAAAQKLGDPDLEMTHTMNIGELNQRIGNLEDAETFLKVALKIALDNDMHFRIGQSYLNLAVLEYQKQNIGSSIDYNNQALEIFQIEEDKPNAARALNNLGFAYNLLGETDKALDYYDRSMELREIGGDRKGMVQTLLNQAGIYKSVRRFNVAEQLSQKALDLAEEIDEKPLVMQVHSFLSQYYEESSQPDKALEHFKSYALVKDSLNLLANQARVKELTAQYDFSRLENENQLQLQENELQQLRINQRNQTILIISILFVVIIAWFIWNRNSLRNKLRISHKDRLIASQEAELRIKELDIEKERLVQYSERLLSKNQALEQKRQLLSAKVTVNLEEKNEIDQLIESLHTSILDEKDWAAFRLYFDAVYPGYFAKVKQEKNIELTLSEQRLACLMRIKLTTKEIADILAISPDSVLKSKTRLRQKMGFESVKALDEYLSDL